MSFNDQVVMVTGAGSGIGAVTAMAFAAEGARVLLVDIDAGRLDQVVQEIQRQGGHAYACAFDVGEASGWHWARSLMAELGLTLDVLVNNAYVIEVKPLHELTLESWERQLRIDLTAVYLGVHTFAAQLMANRGSIVNVASVHAVTAWPGHPAYAAAKGGMVALTRQLAVEYGSAIRVNAVLPGPILTATWDGVSEAGLAQAAAQTALGRMGSAAEVAAAITFLASNAASFVTGVSLPVDGGQTIKAQG
ncbi:MAG: SDR family NAD(P)-dependent oxidoreductase [Propionibacteriaceae bacterium]|nr:SDR family oxidoreductase [Micropruina sp.]HBX80268.1 short-chain dehydrogenase [Propionibacteriaceae bacterium]HBY23824.1 short-chain dehydrogenase [Propionibacteriaceae bacterium]